MDLLGDQFNARCHYGAPVSNACDGRGTLHRLTVRRTSDVEYNLLQYNVGELYTCTTMGRINWRRLTRKTMNAENPLGLRRKTVARRARFFFVGIISLTKTNTRFYRGGGGTLSVYPWPGFLYRRRHSTLTLRSGSRHRVGTQTILFMLCSGASVHVIIDYRTFPPLILLLKQDMTKNTIMYL